MLKKNPTTQELTKEVELLQSQLIAESKKFTAYRKNNPDKQELDRIKSKWWFKLFNWLRV